MELNYTLQRAEGIVVYMVELSYSRLDGGYNDIFILFHVKKIKNQKTSFSKL